MDWIEIKTSCEMPKTGEIVLISDGDEWTHACYSQGKFHPVDSEGYAGMSDEVTGATHWARPELPRAN